MIMIGMTSNHIVYCKDYVYCKRRPEFEILGVECVWIELVDKDEKYLIGTFYRPPNSNNEIWERIEQSIELACDTNIKNIIITGDLNECQLNATGRTKINSICNSYNLLQVITEPTNVTETSESLIDVFMTNNPNAIVHSAVIEPFFDVNVRYHRPIVALLRSDKYKYPSYKRKIWLYDQGNYHDYRAKLKAVEWDNIINMENTLENIANSLSEHILKAASETIPNRVITVRQNDLPWITSEIRKLMRKRDRSRRKAKKVNSEYHWSKFKALRNEVVDLLRLAKSKYHESLCDQIKNDKFSSKEWWKLVKQLSNMNKKSHGIKILVSNDDTIITDDLDKANLLNSFFASQSIIDESNATLPVNNELNIGNKPILERIAITEADVKDILSILDTTKAVGPDFISPRLLKEASVELAKPLCKLFNLSLTKQIFPNEWKTANVVPVFKKDDPQKVNNYRPISLLSVVSKVFEKCVYKYLHNFIVTNKLLSPHQSGFCERDSTINQLLYIYNEFSHALDEGKEIRVVFFDISKAFDRVWHQGLLFKIRNFGIQGSLLSWIKSYLSNRKQKVIINGKESTVLEINAGVPQGSILGPLFFLIFINDIVVDIGCTIKLFADDTSIYIVIENPNLGAVILNENLEKVNQWSKQWLVTFNPNKPESLLISRKQNQNIHPPLLFDNVPVKEVNSHKHLGLTFNNSCHWGEHIDNILANAYKKLTILRSLKFDLDRNTLQTMYFSFIRPSLEYGDVIFDNCPLYCKDKLEKINIDAARIVTGATKLVSRTQLYKECGWEKLEERREKHKLVQFYKMKNFLTPEYLSNLLPPQHDERHGYNTRNSQNLVMPQCRTSYHLNSFIPTCIRLWNSLPNHIKSANSLNAFKYNLNSTEDERDVPKYYNVGCRKGQILHARLRMSCSGLRHHLFLCNIENDPTCACGEIESATHFLLECSNYFNQRLELSNTLDFPLTCKILLYGDKTKSFDFNKNIFINVQNYILKTKRFK